MSLLTKTLLVMKLSAILILVTSLHVAARSSAQKVTYSGNAVELPKILSVIREQTGYVFFYDKKDLQGLGPISVAIRDASLEAAFKIIFYDLPLDFQIQGNTVFINKKAPIIIHTPPAPESPEAANDTLRGYVRDSTGEPLSGASVIIKGTTTGTRTNIKGEFALYHIKPGTTLVISYTGYTDQEITTAGSSFVYLMMKRTHDILDAPVIQAYGTTSRRFSVGSISTVNAETIEKQPVTNVLLALAGQAPGLAINAQSGVPGSRILVQVRGQNNLVNNPPYGFKPYDQPLFLVDGVPFATQNANISQLTSLASANSFSGGISVSGGLSPFNNINPADIESVSILKDADATSIYGTQGANGVILITTKKGKPGRSTFNMQVNTGINTRARGVKLMNTQQYLQLRKDALKADGVAPNNIPYSLGFAPDVSIFDSTRYTDWEHLIFDRSSTNTDVHASLSGGSYNNTFLVSVGYTRSNYNYPGSFADQRYSLHSTFHHASTDNRLSVDFGSDYSYDGNNSAAFGGANIAFAPPNLPELLDPSGNLVWKYKGVNLQSYQFYSGLLRPTMTKNYNMNQTVRIGYKIMTGLSFTVNMGYNRNNTAEHSISPGKAQPTPYPSTYFSTNNAEAVNVEPQLDFTTSIGRGVFSALVGGTYKKSTSNSTYTYGGGYANDAFLGSLNGATTQNTTDGYGIYKYSAGFARLKYVYDSKYIVSLTGRRDGSSNFGPGNQFGSFGSAGLGWIFSEENGFKATLPFVSYAKFSGNYGTNGSDGVAAYQYQPFWTPTFNVPPFQGAAPNNPVNLYNPDYSWALKKSLNLAVDLGFFQDRLLLNVTYYRNRQGNQLGGYLLPIQVGFGSVTQNLPGTVQNKGWEFSVTSSNIKTKSFSWTTTFNISFNRNRLLDFPNLMSSPYRKLYSLGQPLSIIYGYRFKGLNDTTGLFEYYKGKGGVTTSPSSNLAVDGGDQYVIGNREVRYMGGIGNTISYKRFSVYMFFQFSSQTAPNYLAAIYSTVPGSSMTNQPVEALDYWKKPGDHTTLMKLATGYASSAYNAAGVFSLSDAAYTDDTYLRLKTLSVSYSLPEKMTRKLHMQDLRIYGSSQNLLTITNYKVGDPEQFTFTGFPLQRTTVIGLNLNF
ncbi:MAG: SusC/RagA family TonB-linked outer membrane protein [Bacteroidetes bacterium]|nr:SusC/RagA family TonB-linked outer membrane protein [Bacteroidota bacterium]